MSAWTIELPGYNRPPLSLNDRGHWGAAHRVRVGLMETVHTMALAHQLPRGLEHVGIVLHWRVNDRRRRDEDNLAPTLKACVDALTRGTKSRPGYGLAVDDDWLHVTSGRVIELDRARPPGLWLEITDLSGVVSGV